MNKLRCLLDKTLAVLTALASVAAVCTAENADAEHWRFVSMPDFINYEIESTKEKMTKLNIMQEIVQ